MVMSFGVSARLGVEFVPTRNTLKMSIRGEMLVTNVNEYSIGLHRFHSSIRCGATYLFGNDLFGSDLFGQWAMK